MSTETLFAYGWFKTGGRDWLRLLSPRIGTLEAVPGYRLHYADADTPIAIAAAGKVEVYGEAFRGLPEGTLALVDQALGMERRQEKTERGERVWIHFTPSLPRGAEPMMGGRWRSPSFTPELYKLAVERLNKAKGRVEKDLAMLTIRDEIRPLVQANWVSIPWRVGASLSVSEECQRYMDRLKFAAEIGM